MSAGKLTPREQSVVRQLASTRKDFTAARLAAHDHRKEVRHLRLNIAAGTPHKVQVRLDTKVERLREKLAQLRSDSQHFG
jgi:hypothetical protein